MDHRLRMTALQGLCRQAEAPGRVSRPSEAYIAGFRKAAEAAGADPDMLLKEAGSWVENALRGAGSFLAGMGSGALGVLSYIPGSKYLGVEKLKRNLDDWQYKNNIEYMANNNMDPNSLNGWERAGLFGMGLANTAGSAISDTLAWNKAFGLAGKAWGAAKKGLTAGTQALEAARGGTGALSSVVNGAHRVIDPVTSTVNRGVAAVKSRFHLPGASGAAGTAGASGVAGASGATGAAGTVGAAEAAGAAGAAGASEATGAGKSLWSKFKPAAGNLWNAYMAKSWAWDPAWEQTNNAIATSGDFANMPLSERFPAN